MTVLPRAVRGVAFLLAAAISAVAFTQEEEPTASTRGEPTPDLVEQLLRLEEALLTGTGYSYDPGNRRDPFVSLLDARPSRREPARRPEGIAGLLIEEIELVGVFTTPRARVAQVTAANREGSHLLRVGDRVFDGVVIAVHDREVVFRQEARDPAAVRPYREVVRRLRP